MASGKLRLECRLAIRACSLRAEGLPLKNLTVRAEHQAVSGELLITRHGLEGGAIYRLGRTLRSMEQPALTIDFKPQLTADALRQRAVDLLGDNDWFRAWKLSAAAIALAETFFPEDCKDRELLIARIKKFEIPLRGPRPIAEAISSAGGIRWSEIDDKMMLRKMPGVFVAGEMIDWEAPTGGYLVARLFQHRDASRASSSGMARGKLRIADC